MNLLLWRTSDCLKWSVPAAAEIFGTPSRVTFAEWCVAAAVEGDGCRTLSESTCGTVSWRRPLHLAKCYLQLGAAQTANETPLLRRLRFSNGLHLETQPTDSRYPLPQTSEPRHFALKFRCSPCFVWWTIKKDGIIMMMMRCDGCRRGNCRGVSSAARRFQNFGLIDK